MAHTVITNEAHRQSKRKSASRRRTSEKTPRENKSSKGSKRSRSRDRNRSVVGFIRDTFRSNRASWDDYPKKTPRRRDMTDQYNAYGHPRNDHRHAYHNRASSQALHNLQGIYGQYPPVSHGQTYEQPSVPARHSTMHPTTRHPVFTVPGSAQTGYSPEIPDFCQHQGIPLEDVHHVEAAHTRRGLMIYTVITNEAHEQSKGKSASTRRSPVGTTKENKSGRDSEHSESREHNRSTVGSPPDAFISGHASRDGYHQDPQSRHRRNVPQHTYSNRASS
jgi:hypothetical protein